MSWFEERKRHSQAAKKGHRSKRNPRRTVTRVIDGDTFKVARSLRGSRFIRIAGLDAPEKGERGYKQSKRRLAKAIKDKTISLRPVGKSYGRTVAKITSRSPAIRRLKKKRE